MARDSTAQDMLEPLQLGRILKGARLRAGYERAADLIPQLWRISGKRWHQNTVYDVESGKRVPALSLLLAYMIATNLRFEEIAPAVHQSQRDAFSKLISGQKESER